MHPGSEKTRVASAEDLTLIIPAYRESARIENFVRHIRSIAAAPELKGIEVLVLVERSPDSTLELLQQAMTPWKWVRVIDNKVHKGKGFAVSCGARYCATTDRSFVGFCDFDFSTPPQEISRALQEMRRHPELSLWLGERLSQARQTQSVFRQWAGKCFARLTRFVLLGVRDSQCGFKFCRRGPALQELAQIQETGFAFDTEWILKCQRQGLKWAQRPVLWTDCEGSRVQVSRVALGMLISIVQQWFKWGWPESRRRGLELDLAKNEGAPRTDLAA